MKLPITISRGRLLGPFGIIARIYFLLYKAIQLFLQLLKLIPEYFSCDNFTHDEF